MKFISTYTRPGQEQDYLDVFNNVTIQPRADNLAERLAIAASLLQGDQTISIAISPWRGDTKWAMDSGITFNFDFILDYANMLSKWREICEPYMDVIGHIITEGEWGDTREWTDTTLITDMNNITRHMIKHFFDQPLLMYGRGMMTYYTENRVDLTPWWNGPSDEAVDFITPFLYDPLRPDVENRSIIASAELANLHNISLAPFIGFGIKSVGGHELIDYAPETELGRGLLIKHFADQIDVLGMYPAPDMVDAKQLQRFHWFKRGLGLI